LKPWFTSQVQHREQYKRHVSDSKKMRSNERFTACFAVRERERERERDKQGETNMSGMHYKQISSQAERAWTLSKQAQGGAAQLKATAHSGTGKHPATHHTTERADPANERIVSSGRGMKYRRSVREQAECERLSG
jgi:hypothetical protein